MTDVVVVVATVAFFGLAAAFVQLCERIIGPDVAQTAIASPPVEPELVR
jgi:hypothetical protein